MTKITYRQSIISQLKTLLKTITTTNGYGNNVVDVVEWEDWYDMSANDIIEIRDAETYSADGLQSIECQMVIQTSFVTSTIEKCRLFIADLNLFCKNYDTQITDVETVDVDDDGEQIDVKHDKNKIFIVSTNLIIRYKIKKWEHYKT
jgi:hypothetical protein